jgi:hypothetical protein
MSGTGVIYGLVGPGGINYIGQTIEPTERAGMRKPRSEAAKDNMRAGWVVRRAAKGALCY